MPEDELDIGESLEDGHEIAHVGVGSRVTDDDGLGLLCPRMEFLEILILGNNQDCHFNMISTKIAMKIFLK